MGEISRLNWKCIKSCPLYNILAIPVIIMNHLKNKLVLTYVPTNIWTGPKRITSKILAKIAFFACVPPFLARFFRFPPVFTGMLSLDKIEYMYIITCNFISMSIVFYGETSCSHVIASGKRRGEPCSNNAYYEVKGIYLCGVHTKKEDRDPLPKNPRRKELTEKQMAAERRHIDEVAKKNQKKGVKGQITVTKLRMMKKPENLDGYLKIFPNFKHQNRKDGFGCSSLSPKALGPVKHKMPGLPVALNIENYHQFAKIFSFEVKNRKTREQAKQLRVEAYKSTIPHRHKYDIKTLKQYGNGNANIPLYSVYYDQDSREHRYTYIQCRYFYCHWYEKLAKKTEDFEELCRLIDDGYNLQIVGYDGFEPSDLYDHYLDDSRPFGHELVLYSLLVIDDPAEYPWNRYYDEYWDIYEGVI